MVTDNRHTIIPITKTSHLYNIHVSKELLHRKDLITVIVWEQVFTVFSKIHDLSVLLVPGVVCRAADEILLRPPLVLFAVLPFRLR